MIERTDTEQAEWLADKLPAYGDYAKEAAELLRKLAGELSAIRGIAKFGATCFAEHRSEMSELDGGWLHDKAKECGLIAGRLVTAEMWDGCGSVYCECEVGETCYFPTETGKAAIQLAKAVSPDPQP